MNMKQLAKLIAGGVLAMAAVPAISLARTHHPVQAIAPSLSATTITPMTSTLKHSRVALSAKKHRVLSAHKKTAKALVHRGVKRAALSHRTRSHAALSSAARKATKLSSRKTGL